MCRGGVNDERAVRLHLCRNGIGGRDSKSGMRYALECGLGKIWTQECMARELINSHPGDFSISLFLQKQQRHLSSFSLGIKSNSKERGAQSVGGDKCLPGGQRVKERNEAIPLQAGRWIKCFFTHVHISKPRTGS